MGMSEAFIDVIGVVPVQVVFAYALTRMLSIRRLPLYWTLEMAAVVLLAVFRSEMGVEFRPLVFLLIVLVPLALSEGRLSHRILVVVLAHIVFFLAELPAGVLWMAMTGEPVADYQEVRAHFGAFLAVHAAHLVLVVFLLLALGQALDRFSEANRDRGEDAWLPVLFTLAQLALVSVMILLPLEYAGHDLRYYAVGLALSLVGAVADVLLFASLDRFAQKRRDDARTAALEERLDGYLARCGGFVESVERTAKLRHDVANQVQVALALSERGMTGEAREHLALMRRELASPNGEEGEA